MRRTAVARNGIPSPSELPAWREMHLPERLPRDERDVAWDQGHHAGGKEPEHPGSERDYEIEMSHFLCAPRHTGQRYLPVSFLIVAMRSSSLAGPYPALTRWPPLSIAAQ